MATSKTQQRRIEAQERRAKAIQLRRMGYSMGRIAERLGMSKSSVHKTITKAIDSLQKDIEQDAERARAQELDRIDELQSYLWLNASKGNTQAVEKIIKLMERRHKLLGLDAPNKVAATDPDGDEARGGVVMVPAPAASIDEWVQQAQAHQQSKDEE